MNKKIKGLAFAAAFCATGVANAAVVATIPDATLPRGTVAGLQRADASGVAAQNISLASNVITLSATITLDRLDADPAQGGGYQHGFLLNDVRFLVHPDLNSAFRIQAIDNSYNSGNQRHTFAPRNNPTEFTITLTPNGTNAAGDTYLDVDVSLVEGTNSATFTYDGNRGGTNDFTTASLGSTVDSFAIFKTDFREETSGSSNGQFTTSSFADAQLDVAAVPEPSSAILGITGLGLLAFRRKRA